jgi:hypothetical protein
MWGAADEAMGGSGPETPLQQAQALAYGAFARPDPAERVCMARQALAISPDCADAHVLLAEHAASAPEALEHFRLGVAAGERALGPSTFRDEVGHFWRLLQTRPYMRAREGLAHALWSAVRNDQAIEHLREMLRLNPDDNQGVRFTLASWLLTIGRDYDVESLLERYPDAAWNSWLTRALIAFRRHGDTPEGRRLLRIGQKSNRFILPWLLGDVSFPETRPAGHTPRSPEEAYFYVEAARCAWRSASGAITWLRRTLAEPTASPSPLTETFRPPAADRSRLGRVPCSSEIWQAGFRRVPMWIKSGDERTIPWIVLVDSPGSGLVLNSTLLTAEPSVADLWGSIAKAIERPAVGGPDRPAAVEVRADPRWGQLRSALEDIGIELEECDALENIDERLDDLTAFLLKDEPPGLLDMSRVTPEIVGGVFRAAADYYRRAPWRVLGDGYAIRLECPRFDCGPWSAVVMGKAGQTLGLALYDRLDQLRELWESRDSDRERELAIRMTSLVLTFDRESVVPPKDTDAAARHGWEVIDPETFPVPSRKESGMRLRPPLSWELVLLEGCLRVVPAFLSRHPPGDDARSNMTVPVATGELDLVLSWVENDGDWRARHR